MVSKAGIKGMINSKRKHLRIACKTVLLICLPMAGFFWALAGDQLMLIYAVGLTAISGVTGFIAETLATSTEDDIKHLEEKIRQDRLHRNERLAILDDRLKKLDRISKIFEDQNHDMRADIITTLVRKQRNHDAVGQ